MHNVCTVLFKFSDQWSTTFSIISKPSLKFFENTIDTPAIFAQSYTMQVLLRWRLYHCKLSFCHYWSIKHVMYLSSFTLIYITWLWMVHHSLLSLKSKKRHFSFSTAYHSFLMLLKFWLIHDNPTVAYPC